MMKDEPRIRKHEPQTSQRPVQRSLDFSPQVVRSVEGDFKFVKDAEDDGTAFIADQNSQHLRPALFHRDLLKKAQQQRRPHFGSQRMVTVKLNPRAIRKGEIGVTGILRDAGAEMLKKTLGGSLTWQAGPVREPRCRVHGHAQQCLTCWPRKKKMLPADPFRIPGVRVAQVLSNPCVFCLISTHIAKDYARCQTIPLAA